MTDPSELLEEYYDELPDRMREKFEKGQKEYGDAWLEIEDEEYLLRRMEEEFYEFRQAVEHDRDEPAALEEMADIVNFGLMWLALRRERDQP